MLFEPGMRIVGGEECWPQKGRVGGRSLESPLSLSLSSEWLRPDSIYNYAGSDQHVRPSPCGQEG